MKRIAVIGCGMRAKAYMEQLSHMDRKLWQLTAVADPESERRLFFKNRYGDEGTLEFQAGPALLDATGSSLDGVIIATPNLEHLASFTHALQHRMIVLLEKPVGTSTKECMTMWDAYRKSEGQEVLVGFVLRFSPFYSKIMSLLSQNAVGRVLTIEAAELMGPPLTALYMRGWRRFEKVAGPFINEKCSHDLDLLNLMAGAAAARVASFGGLSRFNSLARAGERCDDCTISDQCRYNAAKMRPYTLTPELGVQEKNDVCVFNSKKDIPDHQTVQVQYENGVIATLTVVMDQPRTTRTIRISGTEGQITGDLERDQITISRHSRGDGSAQTEEERVQIDHDASSHGGGDSIISSCFASMLAGEPFDISAGLREGIEACLVGFAAEESRRTGGIAKVEHLA